MSREEVRALNPLTAYRDMDTGMPLYWGWRGREDYCRFGGRTRVQSGVYCVTSPGRSL